MYNTKIIETTGGTALDLKTDLPISVNKSIADITEPDKRNGAFSKSIQLYSTPNNNKFFEFSFNVNLEAQTFNPNLKSPVYVTVDEIEVLRGDLKLSSIELIKENDTESIVYNCEIYGDNTTLFTEISDSKLEDLDLSAYNHTYNTTNIVASWSATTGQGYVYPIIDYGYKGYGQDHYYHIEHLRPAIYAKQYVDSIFSAAGKTYTSTFLTSSFFKSLIIPHNGDELKIAQATLDTYQFYAGRLSTDTLQNFPLSYNAFYQNWKTTANILGVSGGAIQTDTKTHIPNDDSTAPFNDSGNVYSTSTGTFIPAITANYNIYTKVALKVKANAPAGTVTISNSAGFATYNVLLESSDSGTTWTPKLSKFSQNSSYSPTTSYTDLDLIAEWNNVAMTTGYHYRVITTLVASGQNGGVVFKDGANNPITTGTASLDVQQDAGAAFVVNVADPKLRDGQPLVMNDAIPRDVKQRDFLKGLINMFNLYFDVDKDNPDNYIIEERDSYISTGTNRDWTSKLATDYPFIINPMGLLDAKTYLYQYKEDKDYYNENYQAQYLEPYATKSNIITNDFLKNEKKVDVIFSATPSVDNAINDMIVPKIFSYDNTTVKPIKHNLRILQYGGLISSGTTWDLTDSSGSNYKTTYPYAGMLDSPTSPTVSLDWGVPNKIYFTLPAQQYTDNNLFNKYHYRLINEITDNDSKIVTAYFYLTPSDILTFDFTDTIFIEDAYYIVNKIMDYNPVKQGLTKVELLKLKTYTAYVPSVTYWEDTDVDGGGTSGTELSKPQGNTVEQGLNNNGENSFIL